MMMKTLPIDALLLSFAFPVSFVLFCLFWLLFDYFQDQEKASTQFKEYIAKLELENKENQKTLKAAQEQWV